MVPDSKYEQRLVDMIDMPDWKAILISLVESEEMQVWNIDIEKLSKTYYEKIKELEQTNFKISANAMLACAILLKMKAKALKIPSIVEEDDNEILELDVVLPDLHPVTRIRESNVTLDDLIISIEEVMQKTEKKTQKILKERQEARPVIDMAHYEEPDLEQTLDLIYSKTEKLSKNGKLVLFSNLIEEKTAGNAVQTFLPLLFLSQRGKILMFQEEFFSDIFIRVL